MLELKKIIIESEFSKKELITLYKERLGICYKEDPAIKISFKNEFNNILFQLERKCNPDFFVQSLNYFLEIFDSGAFFDTCLNQLISIIFKDEDINSHELIKKLSIAIIGEFFFKEFSINTIKSIPKIIFSKYDNNNRIHASGSSFPHGIKWEDDDNPDTYSDKVINFLNDLSIEDRITKISNLFYKEPQEGHFIFNLNGFLGDGELKFENIHLYSPHKFRYIRDEKCTSEFFGKSGNNIVNAAIFLKFRDVEYSKNIAINELNKVFDLIRAFSYTTIPFEVYPYDYYVVNDGETIHGNLNLGPKHELFINEESLKFSELNSPDFIEKINSLLKGTDLQKISNDREDSVTKIISSALFFRKGFESNLFENKHLNYWISIENFTNIKKLNIVYDSNNESSPLEIAKQIIPQLIILHEIDSIVIDLFYYLWNNLNHTHRSPGGKKYPNLEIEESLKRECQLDNENYERDLSKFLLSIPQLISHVKNDLILEKLKFVNDLYFDTDFGRKYLDLRKKEITNDLIIIYQIRNQIVHKAHLDPIRFFFYTKKAENYCRFLLLKIINQYSYENIFNFNSLIYRKTYDYTLLYDQLKNEPNFNLFQYFSNKSN